jgi:hypothetical protein
MFANAVSTLSVSEEQANVLMSAVVRQGALDPRNRRQDPGEVGRVELQTQSHLSGGKCCSNAGVASIEW